MDREAWHAAVHGVTKSQTSQFGVFQGEPVYLFLLLPATVLGSLAGCLVGAWRSRGNVEIGLVPPAAAAMTILCFLIGILP